MLVLLVSKSITTLERDRPRKLDDIANYSLRKDLEDLFVINLFLKNMFNYICQGQTHSCYTPTYETNINTKNIHV